MLPRRINYMKEQIFKQSPLKSIPRRSQDWKVAMLLTAALAGGTIIIASSSRRPEAPPARTASSASHALAGPQADSNITLGMPTKPMASAPKAEKSGGTRTRKVSGDPFKDDEGRSLLIGDAEKVVGSKAYKEAIRTIPLFRTRIQGAMKGPQLDAVESDVLNYFSNLSSKDPRVFSEFRPDFNELLELIHFKRTGERIRRD